MVIWNKPPQDRMTDRQTRLKLLPLPTSWRTVKLCSHQAAALQVRDRIGYRNELFVSHQEISHRFDTHLFTCPS